MLPMKSGIHSMLLSMLGHFSLKKKSKSRCIHNVRRKLNACFLYAESGRTGVQNVQKMWVTYLSSINKFQLVMYCFNSNFVSGNPVHVLQPETFWENKIYSCNRKLMANWPHNFMTNAIISIHAACALCGNDPSSSAFNVFCIFTWCAKAVSYKTKIPGYRQTNWCYSGYYSLNYIRHFSYVTVVITI
jgi:hypothetical protein